MAAWVVMLSALMGAVAYRSRASIYSFARTIMSVRAQNTSRCVHELICG